MKIQVQVITARINGKLIFAEIIEDECTTVLVEINRGELDEYTLDVLRNEKFIEEYEFGFDFGCWEAQDQIGTYGNLVIAIESKEIELV